jgi:hypothetical protein
VSHIHTLPTIRVEIGFTSGPLLDTDFWVIGDPVRGQVGVAEIGPDELWTDITEYVRSWSIRRGANSGDQPTRRYEPGTATVELNDPDRRFDPLNLAGPYVLVGLSEVQPMRRIRLHAEWDGVVYPLFSGYTDDWEPQYQSNFWTYVTVTATDGSKVVDRDRPIASSPTAGGEASGARIGRILTSAGWPSADRLLDTGASTLQATTLEGNALSELHLVQDTELGELYVDVRGRFRFRDRRSTLEDPRSTDVQVVYGDAGYELPIDWGFELSVEGFTPTGATIAQSGVQWVEGSKSLLMTVTGSPVQAYVRQTYPLSVLPGRDYMAHVWVYAPSGGSVTVAIDWFDQSDSYLSTSAEATVVSAATWTELPITATAPATAAYARFGPTLTGSPPNGTQLYVDALHWHAPTPEVPYVDAQMANTGDGMANLVTITRVGGTPQQVSDLTSIDRYLEQPFTRTDLLHMSDAEALQYADAILYRHSDPGRRFNRISFRRPPPDLEDVLWPNILDRDFGDRVRVIRRPYGGGDPIQQDCFIRGVTHASDGEDWDTSFVLENAERYSFFTVGHPELGQVGVYPVTY